MRRVRPILPKYSPSICAGKPFKQRCDFRMTDWNLSKLFFGLGDWVSLILGLDINTEVILHNEHRAWRYLASWNPSIFLVPWDQRDGSSLFAGISPKSTLWDGSDALLGLVVSIPPHGRDAQCHMAHLSQECPIELHYQRVFTKRLNIPPKWNRNFQGCFREDKPAQHPPNISKSNSCWSGLWYSPSIWPMECGSSSRL